MKAVPQAAKVLECKHSAVWRWVECHAVVWHGVCEVVAGNRGFVQRDECVEASRDKAEIENRWHWQWSDDCKLELVWQ